MNNMLAAQLQLPASSCALQDYLLAELTYAMPCPLGGNSGLPMGGLECHPGERLAWCAGAHQDGMDPVPLEVVFDRRGEQLRDILDQRGDAGHVARVCRERGLVEVDGDPGCEPGLEQARARPAAAGEEVVDVDARARLRGRRAVSRADGAVGMVSYAS